MEDSLKQYLNLYREHKELICSKSPNLMNGLREEAFKVLEEIGLPKKGSENYEVTDLPAMLSPDYGLNIARIPLDFNPSEGFRCSIPGLGSSLFFQFNDRLGERRDARKQLPEGVVIGPISALEDEKEEISERYGKLASLGNPIVALNTMLVQDGIYLRVRKGVKCEMPIQFVNMLFHTMPLMAARRMLIILEEDASLKIVSCDHTLEKETELASVGVTEIYAGRNSRLELYEVEESTAMTRRMSALYLSQEEGSEVRIGALTLSNGMTRNEYYCTFAGEHSRLDLVGLGIETGKQMLDNYSFINHASPACHTEELFKYIADDEARAGFAGKIYVAPGAHGTEAYQSNRNLVGSAKARIYSKPQLEIYNDDVKCSHGSATGQLDAMQLFYMRSRGIWEPEAKLLLKQAFMAEVLEKIELKPLYERMRALVDRRLSGENASCGNCDICG
ncbi:MAG: Fe-S cluster assembly protein SufD [Muribaculaceae bacterium]|nr:Fe-S cluster assembly protein SufD [Muribaculaceae bacterium]